MNKDVEKIVAAYQKLLKESHPDSTRTYEEDDLDYLQSLIEASVLKDSNVDELTRQEDGSFFVNFSGRGYKINVTPL